MLISHQAIGQSYLRAEVRNTNCPVSAKEADLWYFGKNAGIDFRDGTAQPVATNYVLNALCGSAIICDSLGNLLMFSNGAKVWTRTTEEMPNGGDLHGDPGVKMPALIIPKPGPDPMLYYVFTLDYPKLYPQDTNDWGLQYSEVNMELNGGLGDVTDKKNMPLLPDVVEKISATHHSNGNDTWVLAHRYNSNEFCAFLVTENGVDSNYVSSKVGAIHVGPLDSNNTGGLMKFSPDGSKLALAIYGLDRFEIFDFNNSNGQVGNPISSGPVYPNAFGVEFSPDGRYLYATTTSYTGEPILSYLYQFDVDLGSEIFNNPVVIDSNDNTEYFCGLQLATDGRIYIARSPSGFDELGVIYNPKRPGMECNFNTLNGNPAPFNLGGKRSNYGLPEFDQSYFDLPHFDAENICFSDTTLFKLQNTANVESVTWNFGDPESGANTSTDFEPSHSFTDPGDYIVSVTETDQDGNTYDYSEVVRVAQLPYPELGDTLYMYQGSNIVLDAGEGYKSYLWSTGATSQAITITDPGDYWVYVENEKCCFNGDSVKVVLFDILVPNAFRPGGINSRFRAVPTSGQAINNFVMYVYNRWGQLVYESRDIEEGWDGTYNGQPAPGDVYVWLIQWDILKDTGTERISYKGNVMLLR